MKIKFLLFALQASFLLGAIHGRPNIQCTSDNDCYEPWEECDLSTNTCVGCYDDSGCADGLLHCFVRPDDDPYEPPGESFCVECLNDSHCGGSYPICENHKCHECTRVRTDEDGDSHCQALFPNSPITTCRWFSSVHPYESLYSCQECETDDHCGPSESCLFDLKKCGSLGTNSGFIYLWEDHNHCWGYSSPDSYVSERPCYRNFHVDDVSKKIWSEYETYQLCLQAYFEPNITSGGMLPVRFTKYDNCLLGDSDWSYKPLTKQIESLWMPGWCVDATPPSPFILAPCDGSNSLQRFDVSSFSTAAPTPLPTPSPTADPKQIKVNGKCLQMLDDNTVVARDCQYSQSFKWDYDDSNKRIINQEHNRCLEVATSGEYTLKSGVCGDDNTQKWYQDKNGHIRTYRYEHHCLTLDATTKFSVQNCHKRGLDTQMFEVPSSFEDTSFFVDHYGWGLIKLKTNTSSSTYQCLAMDYDDPNDPDDQEKDYRGTNRQIFAKRCDYKDPRQFWTYYPDTQKLRNKKQYHNGDDQCIAVTNDGSGRVYARTSCDTSSDRYDWWLDENTYLRNGNTPSHWCLHTDSTGVVKVSGCPGNAAAFIQIDSRFGLWGHKTLTPSTTLVRCPQDNDVLGGVMTVEECKGAGLSLGGVLADGHSVTTGTWARVPCGCFLHGSSKTIHFRTECARLPDFSYETEHPWWLLRTLVCRAEADHTGQ